MKYGQWQSQFISEAKARGSGKTDDALLHYKKIYADLRDGGLGEEDAVEKLGNPADAADKFFKRAEKKDDSAADGPGGQGRAQFLSSGAIDELYINGAFCSAEITFFDGDNIFIDYPAAAPFEYKISELGGKLCIECKKLKLKNLGGMKKLADDLKVYLPEKNITDIKADLFASNLNIGSGQFANFYITMNCGSAKTGDIICADAVILSDAGKVELESIVCHRLRADVSAGKINCKSVCGSTADISINAADAKFGLIDCKRTEIDLSMGNAAANFCGEKDDYDADIKKVLSSVNLGGRALGCGRAITAHVNFGKLSVNFENN